MGIADAVVALLLDIHSFGTRSPGNSPPDTLLGTLPGIARYSHTAHSIDPGSRSRNTPAQQQKGNSVGHLVPILSHGRPAVFLAQVPALAEAPVSFSLSDRYPWCQSQPRKYKQRRSCPVVLILCQ